MANKLSQNVYYAISCKISISNPNFESQFRISDTSNTLQISPNLHNPVISSRLP